MKTRNHVALAVSLVSFGLCASLAWLGSSAPAAANEALIGHYLVEHATDGPAPLFIQVTASKGQQTGTEVLRCVLPNGEQSQQVYCPALEASLPVDTYEAGEYASVIAVDFLPIEQVLTAAAFEVTAIDPIHPTVNSAEAEWVGLPEGWVCVIEQIDLDKCNDRCAPNGGQVTASPWMGGSNNAFHEPACEVECKCDGTNTTTTWVDYPQIVPAF